MQHFVAYGVRGALCVELDVAANHEPCQFARVGRSLAGNMASYVAIAQHRDAVGDFDDLAKFVADKYN